MGHGRETPLSLNLMTVCILILDINCIYITGQRGIWHSTLNFAADRGASRKGEGKREKIEKVLTIFFL